MVHTFADVAFACTQTPQSVAVRYVQQQQETTTRGRSTEYSCSSMSALFSGQLTQSSTHQLRQQTLVEADRSHHFHTHNAQARRQDDRMASPTKFFSHQPRHHLLDPLLPNNCIARVPHLLIVRKVDAFKRRRYGRLLRLKEFGLGSRHRG